jgi:hypothetical protein
MKWTILVVGVWAATKTELKGQSVVLERYVLGATGGSRSVVGHYFAATAGQTLVGTRSVGTTTFTQGFQQQTPTIPVARSLLHQRDIILYPNPTDGAFIVSGADPSVSIRADAFDLLGKRIALRQDGLQFSFPPGTVAGIYPLRISTLDTNGKIEYFMTKIEFIP